MRIFRKIHSKLNWSKRRYIGVVLSVFALSYLASAIYHTHKALPQGLDYQSQLKPAQVKFLADRTYINAQGQQQLQQQIFDETLKLIDQAQSTIVIDMFLFNQTRGDSQLEYRPLSQELSNALIKKRHQNPNIEIKFITDPINTVYGGTESAQYRQLRQAGVDVIETNLTPLRASNPVWSGLWYICCQDLGNNPEKGWLTNPFGKEPITLRSYLNLLNFKANHRKIIVADSLDGWKAIVTSANPHDGSARHSNVGLLVSGATAVDILNSEQAVAKMSGGSSPAVIVGEFKYPAQTQAQVLTEAAIYKAVLNLLDTAKAGEHVDLSMFYLSERKTVEALKSAQQRGVKLRVLLDPNKDAFGRQKNGIPNRQVAAELHQAGINVRWCDTHGEQCHTKMMMKSNAENSELILGSANFTARNLKNYNLETDLRVIGNRQQPVFVDAKQFFDQSWSNLDGHQMSVEYARYADDSKLKYWLYRFMEWSGMSTF